MNSRLFLIKSDLRYIFADKKNASALIAIPLLLIIMNIAVYSITFGNLIDVVALTNQSRFWAVTLARYQGTVNPAYLVIFNNVLPLYYLLLQLAFPFIIGISLIIEEKEQGTLETLVCMPMSIRSIFITKLGEIVLPSVVIAWVLGILELSLAIAFVGISGVAILEWTIAVIFVSPAMIFAASSLVLYFSSISKDTREAYQYSLIIAFGVLFGLTIAIYMAIDIVNSIVLVIIGIVMYILALCMLTYINKAIDAERLLFNIKRPKISKN